MADPIYRDRVTYRLGTPLSTPSSPDLYQVDAASSVAPEYYQVNGVAELVPDYYQQIPDAPGGGPGGGGGLLTISAVTGTKSHGGSVVVTGFNFGTKASGPPLLWDDCQGTNPLTLWDGVWGGNERYITPASLGRGVPVAHSHRTKYMVSDHSAGNPDGGVWKTFTKTGYFYVSAYMRLDPLWPDSTLFGTDDNNVKPFVYSDDNGGSGPYAGDYWYLAYNTGTSPFDPHPKWVQDANAFFYDPGYPPGIWGYPPSAQNVTTTWGKVEIVCKTASDSTGSLILYQDGVDSLHRVGGFNDIFSGVDRMIGMGGFVRTRAADSFKYMSDIYIDTTWSRVILSTHSTLYAAGAIQEVQIPVVWLDGSITITMNHGNVPVGAAYIHVIDSDGNSDVFPITTV